MQLPEPVLPDQAILEPLKFPASCDLDWELMQHFEEHGCTISDGGDHVLVAVPAGTVRREVLPRTLEPRGYLIFPDGWTVWEQLRDDVSLVSLVCDEEPAPS